MPGVYVPVEETVAYFKAIVEGEMDDYPEMAFFNVGTIADVKKKAGDAGRSGMSLGCKHENI